MSGTWGQSSTSAMQATYLVYMATVKHRMGDINIGVFFLFVFSLLILCMYIHSVVNLLGIHVHRLIRIIIQSASDEHWIHKCVNSNMYDIQYAAKVTCKPRAALVENLFSPPFRSSLRSCSHHPHCLKRERKSCSSPAILGFFSQQRQRTEKDNSPERGSLGIPALIYTCRLQLRYQFIRQHLNTGYSSESRKTCHFYRCLFQQVTEKYSTSSLTVILLHRGLLMKKATFPLHGQITCVF